MCVCVMAYWVKLFATKPDDFSLTPRTYMVKGKDFFCKLSSDLHTSDHTRTHTHTV